MSVVIGEYLKLLVEFVEFVVGLYGNLLQIYIKKPVINLWLTTATFPSLFCGFKVTVGLCGHGSALFHVVLLGSSGRWHLVGRSLGAACSQGASFTFPNRLCGPCSHSKSIPIVTPMRDWKTGGLEYPGGGTVAAPFWGTPGSCKSS